MKIGTGIGTFGFGLGTKPGTPGTPGAPGVTAPTGTGACCGAGMVPPWYPRLGASGGGGGTGACCWVGNSGMNLPGAAFWCPTTGS